MMVEYNEDLETLFNHERDWKLKDPKRTNADHTWWSTMGHVL